MTEQDIEPEVTEKEALLEIQDLGQFIALLTDWHNRQISTLKHLQEIPEGTEVMVEDAPSIKLEGVALAAFQLGISMSLSYLSTLPISVEYEEEPTLQ